MRILIAVNAVDFRKGIDGLVGICRAFLMEDPMSGCLFIFRNRRGQSLKFLIYDGQGFWLCQKRLSKGTFTWWPKEGRLHPLAVHEFQALLWNGNPDLAPHLWRPLR